MLYASFNPCPMLSLMMRCENWDILYLQRSRKNRGESDEEGEGRERPRKKGRKQKEGKESKKKKQVEDEDGLTAKQRRKVVSKAIISSSEGSESEDEKLKIDDE